MLKTIDTEVLIIGSGIAGCTTALCLADQNINVTLISSSKDLKETNTFYAQGGIVYKGKNDSAKLFAEDIINAGAGYCNPEAVQIIAQQGPRIMKKILLDRIGVQFDKDSSKRFSFVQEGGHRISRIIHSADATGMTIQSSLIGELSNHPNVNILAAHTSIDLLTTSHHSKNPLEIYNIPECVGAYILNNEKGRILKCLAKKTIIATGGLGQIYLRTSNPRGARGDGIVMAYRAGARVINTEFIQFHPTTLYLPGSSNFLISEAVRGAGAKIVHSDGKPFMQNYDSMWKDLAPRDIVARSIHQEMLYKGIENVYLDLKSYIDKEKIINEFPNIYNYCLKFDIDITKELIPIVPAAHYSCGGIWVDLWSRTSLKNLYAVGEAACTGVHGANRLASTSLLEGLVWGYRASQNIIKLGLSYPLYNDEEIPPWQNSSKDVPDLALINQDMSHIKHTMWNYVGLVRSTPRLNRALRELHHLELQIEDFYRKTKVNDSIIGLRNSIRTAIIVTQSAWKNKSSAGCHYRI